MNSKREAPTTRTNFVCTKQLIAVDLGLIFITCIRNNRWRWRQAADQSSTCKKNLSYRGDSSKLCKFTPNY